MSRTVTITLTETEYNKISAASKIENQPMPTFIILTTIKQIEESFCAVPASNSLHYISSTATLSPIKSHK